MQVVQVLWYRPLKESNEENLLNYYGKILGDPAQLGR